MFKSLKNKNDSSMVDAFKKTTTKPHKKKEKRRKWKRHWMNFANTGGI